MLLKSMREANLGEGLGDSEQTQFYQDMFDQQLSVQMSQGKGLGLAERLVQQLQRTGLTPTTAAEAPPAGTAAGTIASPAASPAAGATGAASAGGNTPPTANLTHTQFINGIWPYAEQAAKRIGVAIETVIAHAALETGWGRHLPAAGTAAATADGNNLFGIKAGNGWRGTSGDSATTEYVRGSASTVQAPFRSYASIAAGFNDYADLLTGNPRFATALNQGNDAAAFAQGLQRGGYATDPAYVHKLVATVGAVRELTAHPALKNAAALPTSTGAGTA